MNYLGICVINILNNILVIIHTQTHTHTYQCCGATPRPDSRPILFNISVQV